MLNWCFGARKCHLLLEFLQRHKFGQKKRALVLCDVTLRLAGNHGAECDVMRCYNLYTYSIHVQLHPFWPADERSCVINLKKEACCPTFHGSQSLDQFKCQPFSMLTILLISVVGITSLSRFRRRAYRRPFDFVSFVQTLPVRYEIVI